MHLFLFIGSCGISTKKVTKPVDAEKLKPLLNLFWKELSNSPRRHEWVKLSYDDRDFQDFVVYPESSQKNNCGFYHSRKHRA